MNMLERKRREKGLTQAELAALLGVGQTAVSKWEIGKSLPQADKLPKLAQILGCTVDEILISKEEEKS
jgi:transcriptional regulator with XRE-family HTH domain